MGYIPPSPPHWIEVTRLDSESPEYIEVRSGRYLRASDTGRELAQHRARMDRVHAETMRDAKIMTVLLLAMIVTIVYAVAQFAGLV
jgi:hypothetical protein